VLAIEGLEKRFGSTRAVDGLSLRVTPGEFVGIIGRSGAGKSTLLRLINRLVEPTDGRITYGAVDVTALRGSGVRRWRARCPMIFQQFNLVGRLDVLTNVLIGRVGLRATLPSLVGYFSAAERAAAVRALERLDLLPQALQRAETLSGGQQQRVAIARALMQDAELILADEPVASLDPRNAARVLEALATISREDGLTVLCNLHSLDVARTYCDRIVGMAAGRVVFDGPPASLSASRVREIYGLEETDAVAPVTNGQVVHA
jgi:phosphonate transport system ATP-binding protein